MKNLIVLLFIAISSISGAQSTIQITMNGTECCPTYDTYTAVLTQNETDDIVATVLENTYDYNMVWIRSGVGVYYCDGLFGDNKTVIEGFNTNISYQVIGLDYIGDVYMAAIVTSNRIYIRFYTNLEEDIELSELDTPVSISFRTYPTE